MVFICFFEPSIDPLLFERTSSPLPLLIHQSTLTERLDSFHWIRDSVLTTVFWVIAALMQFILYLCFTNTFFVWLHSYLCLSSDWCHIADLFRAQCVDDGTLSHVGVANEAHADLFLVCVELPEADRRRKLQQLSYNTKHSGKYFPSTDQTWQWVYPKFNFIFLLLITKSVKALGLLSIQHNGFWVEFHEKNS